VDFLHHLRAAAVSKKDSPRLWWQFWGGDKGRFPLQSWSKSSAVDDIR